MGSRVATAILLITFSTTPAMAQTSSRFAAEWIEQASTEPLRSPIAAGHAYDGRPVFVCRANVNAAKLIGWTI